MGVFFYFNWFWGEGEVGDDGVMWVVIGVYGCNGMDKGKYWNEYWFEFC